MSHKKRSKKRKRSKNGSTVVCTRCKTAVDTRPQAYVQAIADTFNEALMAGVEIDLKHHAVYTKYGYVLPTEYEWVARTLVYTEFSSADTESLDE